MMGLTDPRGDASSLRRTARRSSDAAIDGLSRALVCGSKGGCGEGFGRGFFGRRLGEGKGVAGCSEVASRGGLYEVVTTAAECGEEWAATSGGCDRAAPRRRGHGRL